MKRPTPDTDAVAAYEGNWDTKALRMTVHARKLERERDEARKELKEIAEYGTEEINAAVDLRQKLASALIERDDARKELEEYRSIAENIGAEKAVSEKEKAIRERDEACQVQNGLAKQVERLRKERDQLKEALLIMENLLKPGIELFPEIGEILKQGGAK